MNYKVNPIDIKCEGQLSDELPIISTGDANGITVFNASDACRQLNVDFVDSGAFVRANRKFVDRLIRYKQLDVTKMFYVTKDQDLLMDITFVYSYLSFVSEDFFLYFISLVEDVMRNGMALSDGVIYMQAATRLPKNILKRLAEDGE